jgi:hypothetical protein
VVAGGTDIAAVAAVEVTETPSSVAPEHAATTNANDATTRKMRFIADTLPEIPVYGIAFSLGV